MNIKKRILLILCCAVMVSYVFASNADKYRIENNSSQITEKSGNIPNLVDFQGRLNDNVGNPLDSTEIMLFSLYDVETSGTALWSETQSVNVVGGLFHVSLGSVNAISENDFAGSNRWIGITVGADTEMTPRVRVGAVPYALQSGASAPVNKISDADGDTKIQLEESNDEDIIRFDIAGTERWIMQSTRLEPMNNGYSVFIGVDAGAIDNLTNNQNIFIGYQAGKVSTTGYDNTGSGYKAFYSNTEGHSNTAMGHEAMMDNTTGYKNTALGLNALSNNTEGHSNTAIGFWSLFTNTIGIQNMALGSNALKYNSEGSINTAIGSQALNLNTTGDENTAVGSEALKTNTTGSQNTTLGYQADVSSNNLTNATAIGYKAKVATSNSLVLGATGGDAVKVGIGTTSPAQTLDVDGDASIDGTTFNVDDVNNRVGIGTSSPDSTLHVDGGAYVTGGAYITGDIRGESTFKLFDGDQQASIKTNSTGGYVQLDVGGISGHYADAIYIGDINTSSSNEVYMMGNVGIGTSTPDMILHVEKNANADYVVKIKNTANSNSSQDKGVLIQAGHDTYNSGNESSFIQFETPNGTYCGRIRQSGSAAVEYVSASDRRLKENIIPTRFGLDDLMKIEVRDFNFKTDNSSIVQTGFIAQQLYTAYPPAVGVGGEDVNTEPWDVAYGSMTPLLVQAVQEQQAQINELRKMIKKLQGR
ncbi:MAG: hypothetical protein GQ534_10870 [Candidatus Delongbacteria bacterium]|nr:hypothetical protein [Candidatus Delongbacteria bacterium]